MTREPLNYVCHKPLEDRPKGGRCVHVQCAPQYAPCECGLYRVKEGGVAGDGYGNTTQHTRTRCEKEATPERVECACKAYRIEPDPTVTSLDADGREHSMDQCGGYVKDEERYDFSDTPPRHYAGKGGVQVWDLVDAFGLDYYEGNVLKYVVRAGRKDNRLEDLKKARHFIDRMIKNEESE